MSIVLPVGNTFQSWAASLQVDYSNKNVPLPFSDDAWREWADRLVARNTFNNDQIPNTQGFSDWRSWAMRVVQVLNA